MEWFLLAKCLKLETPSLKLFSAIPQGGDFLYCDSEIKMVLLFRCKVITGEQEATLPLAYQQFVRPELDEKQLETILNLCLCDSSFPSFVAQVDKLLKAYIGDGNADKSKSS